MQPYLRTRETSEKNATVTGVLVTVAVHAAIALVLVFTGLSYLDPPPPERTSVLIEFEDEAALEKPLPTTVGRQPQSEEVDLTREVELVQKSESPYVNDRPNTTPAAKPDSHGDVEVPTPPQKEEPKLDPRASFPGMTQKESSATTPHSASEASEGFKAGQPDGNTKTGKTEGSANAHLKGRSLLGTLERPAYNSQEEGVVVVRIKVDQYGTVQEAIPGVEGTTVTDKNLWNAARRAAMKAVFNMSADAPALQEGTITYRFKLQ